MSQRVGIAGTGKMGTAIACNLLERGHGVGVWNVEPAMMQTAVAAGATPFDELETMVAGVDAVIAMLWDDDVAQQISLGRIVPAAREGQLFIECTTLSPPMYERLARAAEERHVDFLAAPVLGSVDGARTGTLTLLPGGSRRAFERAGDLLHAIGSTVKFTGSPAASGHLKLAYNALLAVNAVALDELLAVMDRAGAERTLAIETLMQAIERVAVKRQLLVDRDLAPRFSVDALKKDLRLARTARRSAGADTPLTDRASQAYEAASAHGAEDYIAVALAHERAVS